MSDRKIYSVSVSWDLASKKIEWEPMYFVEFEKGFYPKQEFESLSSDSIVGLAKLIADNAKTENMADFRGIEIRNSTEGEIGEDKKPRYSSQTYEVAFIHDNPWMQTTISRNYLEFEELKELVLTVRDHLLNKK